MMKELRRIQVEFGLSILILGHRRPQRRGVRAPVTLADIAAASPVAELSDSVIAIGPSTCGSDIRYIKHLKSRTGELKYDEQNVAVFRLTRETAAPQAPGAAPAAYLPPQPPAFISFDDLVRHQRQAISPSPNSQLPTPTPVLQTPNSALPTLLHLGFSPESIHLLDHAQRAQLAERLERQQLRRSKNIVNTLMSREYKRYLER